MKELKITRTSYLYLSLFLTTYSFSQTNFDSALMSNEIEQTFVQSQNHIDTESSTLENANYQNSDNSYLRAPNSYIYDIDLAKQNNYKGLKIPVAKAFEIWSSSDWFLNENLAQDSILSAYVYWEDVHGLISKVFVENPSQGSNSKINVEINPTKGKGNALISLHYGSKGNQNDAIIWSWHIWVTDDPTQGVAFGQGIETDIDENPFQVKFMDRNLGSLYNDLLGDDWHRATGLFYQWGRKDPIPSMVTKDFSFIELNGLVGYMRNREGIHQNNIMPEIARPYTDIKSNLKYSIQNPIHYLIASDNGTWFSAQQYKIADNPNTTTDETVTWDLWSDNRKGMDSNASSSNASLKADSRSYELKSPYDPCPNGWRVPSHLGRSTKNNNHSPWGRKNSGGNDDPIENYSYFKYDQTNQVISKAKVYIGLGIDFTNSRVEERNIGIFPNTGEFVLTNNNQSIVYQDQNAETSLWTATYGLGGARYMRIISDPVRTDVSDYGANLIQINHTSSSTEGRQVRCIQDPNLEKIGNFETEFIPNDKILFTDGLYNPNSYLVVDETKITIPVNKAFSAHEHLFPYEQLPSDHLIANVYWTDNFNLVETVKVEAVHADARFDNIEVTLNPNQKGNAIISLHNGSITNPAYWTWHIWVVADQVNEITYVNQEIMPSPSGHFVNPTETSQPPLTTTFMDRNLGAIHDFPVEISDHPNSAELLSEVKYSGGFHYQWGRKDPIPSFQYVGSTNSYEIYKGVSVDNDGNVTYQPINAATFQSQYTKAYSQYSNLANVSTSDPKHIVASKIIAYSIQNPLTYLHQNTTSNADWISSDLAVAADRWGHGTKKSIYDPCPNGWRVPDVFTVFENIKGSSPWYNGKKLESNQGSANFIGSHYGGQFVTNNNQPLGWVFKDSNYAIGHFPTTGIIGLNQPTQLSGKTNSSAISGIWTAALTQQMKGSALAMKMGILTDQNHRMISAGNHSPVQGLNVRCAKDEKRYDGTKGHDEYSLNTRDFGESGSALSVNEFYPNPVVDHLYSKSKTEYLIEVYNLQGQLVYKGQFQQGKINLNQLSDDVYVSLITHPQSQEKLQFKFIKKHI